MTKQSLNAASTNRTSAPVVPFRRRAAFTRPEPPTPRAVEGRSPKPACDRDQVVVNLLPLVKRVASEMRHHLPAHVDLDDLVSAGTLGLIDAVRRFDIAKHTKIETYARYRIKGAILDGLRTLDTASRDMRKKGKKAEQVFRAIEVKLGRPATDEELAQGLGISLKKWYAAVQELQPVGLDWLRPMQAAELHEPDQESLPAPDATNQFDLCYRREQRELLAQALRRISERERQILRCYYEQDLTMKQIGDQMGIDESRVSQIHSQALARLRGQVAQMTRTRRAPQASVELKAA